RMSIPSDGTGSIMGDTTPPANFSLLAPAYAKKYGVDPQELKDVMARIAWKNHQNGAKNPLAQFRKAVAKEAICASPLVAGQLGFAERGFGWKEVLAGTFDLDGDLPVNPDGGLKAFGHPIGASGLRMMYECWLQLRGEAPPDRRITTVGQGKKLALTHNLGG